MLNISKVYVCLRCISICALFMLAACTSHGQSVKGEPECIVPKFIEIKKSSGYKYNVINIDKPGHYCLDQNIRAPKDFLDVIYVENLVSISASDVTLDMRGYLIGRSVLETNQPHGFGIDLMEKVKSVLIKNGTIMDYQFCVYHYGFPSESPYSVQNYNKPPFRKPITIKKGTLLGATNIRFENMTFKNCSNDIQID